MKIRKGDTVIMLSGKDKGSTGKVLEVHPKTNKVLVDGINKATVHKKAPDQTRPGGKFDEFKPVDVSKVGLVHPSKKNRASRVGYKIDAKGKKTRIYRANSKEVKA